MKPSNFKFPVSIIFSEDINFEKSQEQKIFFLFIILLGCLAINDMTPERDTEWMLDTAQKCSIIVLNLKWARADAKNSIYYGWLLSKSNCYYVCDDETAKMVGLFNTNRVESIIEPIKQLEE